MYLCVLLSPAEIAENIKTAAKAQHIAVIELLKAQHIAVNTVQKMAAYGLWPRLDTMAKIAAGLGCTVDALIYRSTEPEQAGDDQQPTE